PYVLFFLIPHGREALTFSREVQAGAPTGTAWQHHLAAYAYWNGTVPLSTHLRPVTTVLTLPLFRWSIPAALVGPPLLLLLPSTRALAIAALPHLLFILFGARHKQVNYTGYLAPEIALYLAATLSVGLTAVFALASRLPRGRLVATIGTAGVAAALIA